MGSLLTCSNDGMRMTLFSRSAVFTRLTKRTTFSLDASVAVSERAAQGCALVDAATSLVARVGAGTSALVAAAALMRAAALFAATSSAFAAPPFIAGASARAGDIAYGSIGGFSG